MGLREFKSDRLSSMSILGRRGSVRSFRGRYRRNDPQMLVASGHYLTVLGRLTAPQPTLRNFRSIGGCPDAVVPTDLGDTASVLAAFRVYRTRG